MLIFFQLKVNDVELTFKLVEGDEETTFLANAVEEMQKHRANFNSRKGGRGRQHFTRKRKNDEEAQLKGKRAKVDG